MRLPLLFFFLIPTIVHAEIQFSDSRVWKRAKLINPSQQVWSFQTSYQNSSNRFASFGRIEPLGRSYQRSVTWQRLLESEGSVQVRNQMEKYMSDSGAKSGDIAATASYEMQGEDLGFSIDWAYGLTKRWMIGFQVPFTLQTINVKSKVSMTSILARGAARIAAAQPRPTNMKERVKALAESELEGSGYDRVPEQRTQWTWGDINLMSQVNILSRRNWTWSLQQVLRFPTSRNPSVSDFLQQMTNDGQMDLGLNTLLDYQVKRWTLGLRLGAVAQLPDTSTMRVEETGSGTAAVDYTVDRDLGDWAWGSLDADLRVTSRLTLNAEYSYLSKAEDQYSGSALPARDYQMLAENTNQELHQTRVGALYKMGDSDVRSGVENKWVASIGYTYPWLGQNSLDSSRASLELINYF